MLALCLLGTGVRAFGQASPQASSPGASIVIGTVTAVEAASNQLSVRTDAGETLLVILSEKSSSRRVPAGEKSFDKAVPIKLTEINSGDRVLADGQFSADKKSLAARQLIVMTKTEIAQKQQHEREDWRRRSVSGQVVAINPATKEITLRARSPQGNMPLIVEASGEGTRFRRYTPDAITFSNARPSAFEQLQIGDQLRALGDKSGDGTRFTAQEIVSGSFHMIGGTVSTVNPGARQIVINDVQTQQPWVITLVKDSTLRRLPKELSALLLSNRGGAGAAGSHAGAETELQEAIERAPALLLEELKPGDLLLVSSTNGTGPSNVTAIIVLAGVDDFLKQFQQQFKRQGSKTPALETGLPGGIGAP
jgi:TusA-related sulfurtransferase